MIMCECSYAHILPPLPPSWRKYLMGHGGGGGGGLGLEGEGVH
jgi:hypothetical protein